MNRLPEPIRRWSMFYKDLPQTHAQAIKLKLDEYEDSKYTPSYLDSRVWIETYSVDVMKNLIGDVWKWSTSIDQLKYRKSKQLTDADKNYYQNEISRVRKIMRLIPVHGQWPYISHWAKNLQELYETTLEPTGEFSIPNHGDGWHRCIAAFELKLPTIDIVFV